MVLKTKHFVASNLSAFYFHLIKDRLYCDSASSLERRSAVTALSQILAHLKLAMHPILPVLTAEIHSCQQQQLADDSKNVKDFVLDSESVLVLSSAWKNPALAQFIEQIAQLKAKALSRLSEMGKPPELKGHDLAVVVSSCNCPVPICGPELREIFQSASATVVQSGDEWSSPDDPEVMTVESDDRTIAVMAKSTGLMLCPRCRLMSRQDVAAEICDRCFAAVKSFTS